MIQHLAIGASALCAWDRPRKRSNTRRHVCREKSTERILSAGCAIDRDAFMSWGTVVLGAIYVGLVGSIIRSFQVYASSVRQNKPED
jgi:hypothetical protein